MEKFKRSKKTELKQVLIDGMETEVIRNAEVICSYDNHVYYKDILRVQFPRSLREKGKMYIADIYKRNTGKGACPFWSAYKGTIRDKTGKVIG